MDQPSQVHTESEHRWDLNEAPSVYTNMFISVDRSMKKFFQKARVNFRRYWNLRTWEISKGTLYYRWSWFHRITKCIQWNLATCWVVDFKDKMQPTLLLCSSYQALNLTLILRPAFWISISFTNQSKDGWAHPYFPLLLRLRLESSAAFQRVENAEFHVAPQVLTSIAKKSILDQCPEEDLQRILQVKYQIHQKHFWCYMP